MLDNAAWDPNFIPEMIGMVDPCRIYASDTDPTIFALVDAVDYQWALQWKWRAKVSRGGKKIYLCRKTSIWLGKGTRIEPNRTQGNAWLHIEVMKRKGEVPPDLWHTIVDHRNSDGLDCQRGNLRWVTPSMNAKNVNGKFAHAPIF
jgi:hypothetical protein